MTKAILVLLLGLSSTMKAQGASDIFTRYAELGAKIEKDITAKVPVAQLNSSLLDLAALGYGIAELYSAQFTECQAQFSSMKGLDAEMRGATWEVLETGYHDGEALPVAPKHCYMGRSMVVHPYMAMAILRSGGAGAEGEISEVVLRVPKIKGRLGI
jgi:hypothetical protein